MLGENFVSLKGTLTNTSYRTVGQYNSRLFKAKFVVPGGERNQYLKVAAWNEVADALNEVGEDVFIHAHGHIEERSYDGACKHCKGQEKRYWTEVVIGNFMVLAEEEA